MPATIPVGFEPDVPEGFEPDPIVPNGFEPDAPEAFRPSMGERELKEVSTTPSLRTDILPPGSDRVPHGTTPLSAFEAGPSNAIQAQRQAELATDPGLSKEEVKQALVDLATQGAPVPTIGESGTALRGVGNAMGGAVQFATSPLGIAAVGAAQVPFLGPALTAYFAGDVTKAAAEKAGEASVTKSPETIAEAATTAAMGGLIGTHLFREAANFNVPARALAKEIGALEIAPPERAADVVALNRIAPSAAAMGPRVLPPTETRGISQAPEAPEMVQLDPNLPYTAAMPREFYPEVQAGVAELANRIKLGRQREAEVASRQLLPVSEQVFRSLSETPGFERTAEQKISQRPLPPEPTRIVEEAEPSGPLKDVEQKVREKLEQRDFVGVVEDLLTVPAESSRALVDKITGVSDKAVPLAAGEKTIFNAIWEQTLQKMGVAPPKPPPSTDIISTLEGAKFKDVGAGVGANPFPEIGKAAWNTAIDLVIGAIKAGRSLESGIREALDHLKKNAKGYDETAVTKYLSDLAAKETPKPVTTTPAEESTRPTPVPADVTLEDVRQRFIPDKEPTVPITKRIGQTAEAFRGGFSSKFRPLDKLAEDIADSYGIKSPKRIAHITEQLKGTSGMAEADVYRFDRDVTRLVGKDEANFDAYMFLRRSIDRLEQDAKDTSNSNRRRVAQYELNTLQPKLDKLKNEMGPEQTARIERAGELFQQHMNTALELQVASGRMSPEVYADIKNGNQFYAPFKLHKYLEDGMRPPGTGRQIDTMSDYAKAMKGIDDPNFKLAHMLGAARQNINISRILAEKNMVMRKFAEMAKDDNKGLFVKELGASEKVPHGMESVNVLDGGKQVRYAVDPDVAASVKLMDTVTNDVITQFLRKTSTPFKLGATTANVAFQPVNLVLADLPRQMLVSKYGVKGASDIIRYPLDWTKSMFSVMGARILGLENKLYLDFLDSGSAGSVLQDWITPRKLKEPVTQPHWGRTILNSPAEFSRAIEEFNKVVGVKRAMREHGVESGKELREKFPEAITEIRRFSGSPDFGRVGKWTESAKLNLLWTFFNARVQGAVADIGRLTGRDGAVTAAKTWVKVGAIVGPATIKLWYLNNLPEYKEDYAKLPDYVKRNYFNIPKDTFIKDQNGNPTRDYWKIPKREMVQLFANMTEAALDFADKRDPSAAWSFGTSTLENLSPINITGDTMGERIESTFAGAHPFIKTGYELASGRDPFKHRDIVPDIQKDARPEIQYNDYTPQLFKKLAEVMPDVAPEALRSPLMLNAITETMTAKLITQFLPEEKPIEGRTGIAANRFMRRFQATPFTEDKKTKEELDSAKREAANEFMTRDRIARKAVEGNVTPSEAVQNAIKEGGKDPKLVERVIDLWQAERSGITSSERQLLHLPVAQRASVIARRIKTLTPDQKSQLLIDYTRKRILTDAVIDAMANELSP